ncbi:hypothetical protein LSTR_LSTR005121 [Laodelphax striatellus]|uniref:PHD-type domain-containing protein n=1 Tax=Laodelphax striatellus TaxID=195883 RepID=A0A482WQ07_LAOST|nr:hypothetical protein LSTR_LSTR005121 [Laodelphax striatellus]
MSEADTDSTDEKLTDEPTSITQAELSSENPTYIKMDATDSSKEDSSSSLEQPKEVSQTSSSSSDIFSLNIGTKDPEKDLKDESNKPTDSPKRVKLIRPEFDKEKLAQKIREIEEREKLKQLNKLKEQELAKSGESSSENKTEEDKPQDSRKYDALDSKNVEESDENVKNEEKSISKSLIETDKLSKVDIKGSVDNVVAAVDSGEKRDEESKESTSVEDSKNVSIKSDAKSTPATSVNLPEKQKPNGNFVEKDSVKTKDSGKEKTRDDQVTSTVGESTSREGLEQKVVIEKQISDPKKAEISEADANVKETNRSQIQAEIKPVEVSTATTSEDVISSTSQQKLVENIDKNKETSDVSKRVLNTGGEKVVSKDIDSTKPVVTGSKIEKDTVTIGKTEQQSVEKDGKSKDDESERAVESKVTENLERKIEKSSSVTEVVKSVPNIENRVEMLEKFKSIESTTSVNVLQQSIESVLDELSVEPSKAVGKLSGKPESMQQESSSETKQKHVDECSNKSDDILLEIEKFIDASDESPKKVPNTVEKSEANKKIVESSSEIVSNVAPTSSKRKLDDEICKEDIKKKYTPTIVDSKETTDKDLGHEKKISLEESMEVSESELSAADIENKGETNVSFDDKNGDDKLSSKDSKDDEATKEAPLETMLDSIIDFEPEPAEVPEEDLVISDIPSTALVESKIPESPRRVKLIRPSKPVTKTFTKPESTQKISQAKPIEQKVVPETKLEKDVSLKSSTEKSQEILEKDEKISDKEDTTKQDEVTKKAVEEVAEEPEREEAKKFDREDLKEEETNTVSGPQPSVKPVELENKLNDSNAPPALEKAKAIEVDSSVEVIPPTDKVAVSKLPVVEKFTTEKPTPSKAQNVEETSSVEPDLKLEEETVEKAQEVAKSVEKSFPNQENVVTEKRSKDISSGELKLEEPVSHSGDKIRERKEETVENPTLFKSTEPPLPSSVVEEKKSVTETIEKSILQKPAAASKLATSEDVTPPEITATHVPSKVACSEEAVKESLVTKEPTDKLTEVPKIPEVSTPEKIDIEKSTPEKASPSTPVESETAKLRRIIRKPRPSSSPNEVKQTETVSSTTVVQGVENKQEILSTSKQDSEIKKGSQDVVLDMTVDEEEEEEGSSSIVTSSETKQEVENKQLGFKLKIAKSSSTIIPKEDKSVSQSTASILAEKLMSQKSTEHTFGSITISATTSKQQTDIKKVEQMLKDTDVTITPLVGRESVQKLDKITLKIGKDGNPPEIKQAGEGRSTEVKRKQVEKGGDDVGSPTRKKMKDESAVLTTSAGVEIDLHMKKTKLLSSLIAEPPMTSQDPRMMMAQQIMAQTSQQIMGLSAQQQAMVQQMMMSSQQGQQMMQQVMGQKPQQLTPQQTNVFLGTPGTPVTPGSEVVKKKRGRPRKIPLPEGTLPQDQQLQALKQQMMMQSQQGSSGTGTSSGSGGSDEYSSGVFPQVPLFDMTESLFDQPHLFPNQVNAMEGRPQRSCRGRIKLPSVRSRKPRGSTMAVRAAGTGRGRGRGRGRGYKRVEQEFTESDNIITLENVKEEMRRQSLEQAQFLTGSSEPMEVTPQETALPTPADPAQPGGGGSTLMKSPEKKPRKRRTEEQERERIEKMKAKREEKKMKTLEKKRKIAEARAREKAAVMAAALVEEETRMSAPERKEDAEKKKETKTPEKKVEGETDVSLVEEPSQPEPIRIVEPEEVSLDTKEQVEFEKEVIEAEESQEPSTPISKPDLVEVASNSCDESVKVEPSSFQDIKKESSTNTDTVEPSSAFVTPRKEKKIYRCLICREESALKKLTSPLDHRSWRVLYQAAIVRGHEEIINLTKNLSDEIPRGILYHRNCRSEFTHKKTLAKLTDTPLPEDSHHHQPTVVKTPGAENINPNTPKEVRMEGTITEYQWPLQGGELYMIQEQVSDFLEITSFKRKYPDIFRRTVEPEEKAYLRENGLVSEAHCDLGLIAVKSSDVLDIMFADFQDKYEEFRKQIRDKQARELSSKHKAAFTSLLMDKRKFENRVLDAKTEAMQAMAAWNSRLNRTRTEQRRCMLDLQSMIVHYPKTVGDKRSRVPNPPDKVGHYPVALVPGQFCDHYKRYNPNELKYFPLNTVIYGPMKPNERFGGGSDGSQSDSDSSSSSDDSSDSSSDSSQDSDASGDESNDKETKGERQRQQPTGETHCKMCGGDKTHNKQDNPEVLINCAQCTKSMHPTCISLTVVMVPHIRRYDWQCTDCKTCIECKDPADEERMLFCDLCDRGYHIYCVGLRKVPNGRWHCQVCSVCNSCGTTDPGGSDWQHEYKKEKNVKVYLQTLCGSCDRQWRKGYYCQICLRCYTKKPEEEQNLIKCTACDRWMHSECCRSAGGGIIMGNSVLCELCQERAMPKSSSKNRERLGSY